MLGWTPHPGGELLILLTGLLGLQEAGPKGPRDPDSRCPLMTSQLDGQSWNSVSLPSGWVYRMTEGGAHPERLPARRGAESLK